VRCCSQAVHLYMPVLCPSDNLCPCDPSRRPAVCICCWYINMFGSLTSDVNRHACFVGGLYEGALRDEAIRRYECLWLPFIARNGGNTSCLPPLDVAYIWHVHRLDPKYNAFCKQAFGHALVSAHPFRFSTTKTGDLVGRSGWKRNEPFYPPRCVPQQSELFCVPTVLMRALSLITNKKTVLIWAG
jgi:hypothetical protein